MDPIFRHTPLSTAKWGRHPPPETTPRSDKLGRVARLLVLCNDTPRTAGWLADEARRLAADRAVTNLRCHRVRHVSPRHPRTYDWLIEIELSAGDASALVDRGRCAELLDDLRLSGAHPIALLLA